MTPVKSAVPPTPKAPVFSPDLFAYRRRKTRVVKVGDVGVGGDHPLRLQSMTTTRTQDTDATVQQAVRLVQAGCEIVRITAPTEVDAKNLKHIAAALRAKGVRVPLVADIHFRPEAALEAAEHVEKVRINPGNFADGKMFKTREYSDREYAEELERIEERFTPLVLKMKKLGRALRIGTNHGSLSDRIMNRYGDSPEGMVESALEFLAICRRNNYHDVIFSMKSSNPKVMIAAYRLLAARLDAQGWDYPFHLGVTEAGDGEDGRIKSAVGIGALLEDGIGDTLRVSLTEDPEFEIPVARRLAARFDGRPAVRYAPRRRDGDAELNPLGDAYHYQRRAARETAVGPIRLGGNHPPRVVTDISALGLSGSDILAALEKALKNSKQIPPEILVQDVSMPEDAGNLSNLKRDLKFETSRLGFLARLTGTEDVAANALDAADGLIVPLKTGPSASFLAAVARAATDAGKSLWLEATDAGELLAAAQNLGERPFNVVLSLRSTDASRLLHQWRFVAAQPFVRQSAWPLLITAPAALDADGFLLSAATLIGGLLCDGLGDAVQLDSGLGLERGLELASNVLQGAGARITKTEFVSCPSCGRTLFDLQTTTERIKKRTGHLKNVKIAIMGCIVNGPGEMADADFGYVGGGPGKINLYVGKECVAKGIPFNEADERLVALIKENKKWTEPHES